MTTVYKSIYDLHDIHTGCVIAIGNFDGLHLGHIELIKTAKLYANEHKIPFGVLTFHPHPRSVLSPDQHHIDLMPIAEKTEKISAFCVDFIILQDFTKEFALISAETFISSILVDILNVKFVVIGYNFRFGSKGLGDHNMLYAHGKKYGFNTTSINEVRYCGNMVSSTILRSLL